MKYFTIHKTALVLGLALALAATAHAGDTLNRIKATHVLTVGYRANSAPFSYAGDNGKIVGYSIDVCRRLAEAIQQQLKLPTLVIRYVPVTVAERTPAIQDGRIDMECAGSTNTKARREQIAFGLTYFYAGVALLVRDGEGIRSLADMKGKVLALVKGSTSTQVIGAYQRRGFGGWQLQEVDTTRAGVEALAQGKVDAVIQDDMQLLPLARQVRRKLVLAGPAMSLEPLSLAFSRDDAEFGELVRTKMRQLYSSQEMFTIYDRWFRQALPGLGYSLDVPLHPLLNDNFRRLSSYVTDWAVL